MIENRENSPVTIGRRIKAVGSTMRRNKFVQRDAINTVIGAVGTPFVPPVLEYLNNNPVQFNEGLSILCAFVGGFVGLLARSAHKQMKEDAIVNQGPGDWGTYQFDDDRTILGYTFDAFKSGQAQLPKSYNVIVDSH